MAMGILITCALAAGIIGVGYFVVYAAWIVLEKLEHRTAETDEEDLLAEVIDGATGKIGEDN